MLVDGTQKFSSHFLMIWGCMMQQEVKYACKNDGRMDEDLFTQVLDDNMKGNLNYYSKNAADVIFQQDNDPMHTYQKAMDWLENNWIKFMACIVPRYNSH